MTTSGKPRLLRRLAGPSGRRGLLALLLAAAWAGWWLGPWWPQTRWSRPSKLVAEAALSPSGTSLLAVEYSGQSIGFAAYDSFRLWDLASGRELFAVQDPAGINSADQTFAPDSSWLASREVRGAITLRDTADGRLRLTIPPPEGPEGVLLWRPFAVAPDGRTLACPLSDDGSVCIQLWDLTAGRELGRLGGGSSDGLPTFAFSPDGRQLAVASLPWPQAREPFRMTLTIWDLPTGQPRATVTTEPDMASLGYARQPLTFSPDGRYLILRTNVPARFWDLSTDPPRNLDHLLADTGRNHQWPANAREYPLFNPQGTRFVMPGPEPSSWVIHDAATLAPVATCRTTGLALDAPIISPDGRRMAVAAGASFAPPPAWEVWLARLLRQPDSFFRPRGHARLIDLTTGAEAGRVPSGSTVIGFSPDSRSLWSYSQRMEGTTGQSVLEVEQWAVPTGRPPAWLLGVTVLGVLLAVADWRHTRRRRTMAARIGDMA